MHHYLVRVGSSPDDFQFMLNRIGLNMDRNGRTGHFSHRYFTACIPYPILITVRLVRIVHPWTIITDIPHPVMVEILLPGVRKIRTSI